MGKEVAVNFKWRDRKGGFHDVAEMKTSHLFFTVRMVWNHSAPESLRITPFKQYDFGSFYTDEYIVEAVRVIASELSGRNDLTDYFKSCLKFMADNFGQINKVKGIEDGSY